MNMKKIVRRAAAVMLLTGLGSLWVLGPEKSVAQAEPPARVYTPMYVGERPGSRS
jgi:hypothetical protein